MKSPAHDLCQDVRDDLVAFLEGHLDARRSATVQVHLRRCTPCRDRWIEFDSLDRLLARPMVKGDFVARTVSAMERAGRVDRAVRRSGFAVGSLVAAAAAILIIIVQLQPPRLTDASETSSARHGRVREPDIFTSGRISFSGGARYLGLPVPPTEGLGRGARRWPSR